MATNNGDLGRIKLVDFENPQFLKRSAGGLFSAKAVPRDVESPKIVQGMLEGSNVQPILEMAKMIEINRKYDGTRTFMTREDERMRAMIKEMGTQA